ncbi:MAG: hypothetical protein EU539_10265 [Promethearchaeota archaeon]|nr:MAG: hypothetical protein EU539_10265 [Candidatus Lokiarchaeota archaeon]
MTEEKKERANQQPLVPWFDPKFSIDRRSKTIPSTHSKGYDPVFSNKEENVQLQEPLPKLKTKKLPLKMENVSLDEEEPYVDQKPQVNKHGHVDFQTLHTIKRESTFYFKGALEKIIFDKSELMLIREALDALQKGEKEVQEVKRAIVDSYLRMNNDLCEFMNFLQKQQNMGWTTTTGNMDPASSKKDLKEAIKEREDFLEELGFKINNIYGKLRNHQEFLQENDDDNVNDADFEYQEARNALYQSHENMMVKISNDAEEALLDGRYQDFFWREHLAVEKLIHLYYLKIFDKMPQEADQLKLLKAICQELQLNPNIINEYYQYRSKRNFVVHDYEETAELEAQEFKFFFENLKESLERAYHDSPS